MPKLRAHSPQTAKLKANGYRREPTLIDKDITENGTYTAAEEGADGYRSVDVNVEPTLIDKIITKNGIYTASQDNADGYREVEVALAFETPDPVVPSTVQQTIEPDEGYEALERVTVAPTPLESLTVQPKTTEETYTPTSPAIGFSDVSVEAYVPPAPLEEKDVNFYDYDGTLLYSYTFAEANELTELPELPTHEGLTAQEWNWSLANIKLQAQNNWSCEVGALYVSADGATYLYFDVPKGSRIPELNINFSLAKNQSVTIDWGDGTTAEETNSTNFAKAVRATKTDYSFKTDNTPLIVKLIGGLFDLGDSSHWGSSMFTNANNSYQFAPLTKVVFGTNCTGLLAGTFTDVRSLQTVINSKDAALKDAYIFKRTGLNFYIFNKNISSTVQSRTFADASALFQTIASDSLFLFRDYNFVNNYVLRKVNIPYGITVIGSQCFQNCYALTYLQLPNTVTTVGSLAFNNCNNLVIIDLTAFTDPSSIPSLDNSNAFSNIKSDAVFYVANQEMLTAFVAATNWSTYADRFQIKGA